HAGVSIKEARHQAFEGVQSDLETHVEWALQQESPKIAEGPDQAPEVSSPQLLDKPGAWKTSPIEIMPTLGGYLASGASGGTSSATARKKWMAHWIIRFGSSMGMFLLSILSAMNLMSIGKTLLGSIVMLLIFGVGFVRTVNAPGTASF